MIWTLPFRYGGGAAVAGKFVRENFMRLRAGKQRNARAIPRSGH